MLTAIKRIKAPKRPKTELEKARTKAALQRRENQFLFLWRAIGGQPLVREHRFHPERKWRFDFAHPGTKTAIEIEGGTWMQGGHNRGKGYAEDCEKYNAAAAAGWAVFRLTSDMIKPKHVEMIREAISANEWRFEDE